MAKGGFRGMPGGMNQAAMMKQAQKLQQEMMRMQQEQEAATYSAKAGGGMVTATVNGKHELLNLQINPEAVEAMRTADTAASENMARLTGGMNLGGLF